MDLKGGTVVSSNGQLKLLESAMNDSHRSLFESQPFLIPIIFGCMFHAYKLLSQCLGWI